MQELFMNILVRTALQETLPAAALDFARNLLDEYEWDEPYRTALAILAGGNPKMMGDVTELFLKELEEPNDT